MILEGLFFLFACNSPQRTQNVQTSSSSSPEAVVQPPHKNPEIQYEALGCGNNFVQQTNEPALDCLKEGKGMSLISIEINVPPAEQNHGVSKMFVMQSEVTQGFYQSITGKQITTNCEENLNKAEANSSQPLYCVSFADVLAFANLLSEKAGLSSCYDLASQNMRLVNSLTCTGYRLPTMMEWRYISSEIQEHEIDEYAWFADNAGEKTHPVAQKRANRFGLYDVYGNVAEWIWKDDQEIPFATDLLGTERIAIGGSAGDTYNNLQFEAARFLSVSKIDEGTGFRLLRVMQ